MQNKLIDSIYKYIIGALIIAGFFLALVYMAFSNALGQYTQVITSMIEVIKNCILLIVGYYWGSSAGSARKDETIKEMTKKPE